MSSMRYSIVAIGKGSSITVSLKEILYVFQLMINRRTRIRMHRIACYDFQFCMKTNKVLNLRGILHDGLSSMADSFNPPVPTYMKIHDRKYMKENDTLVV